MNIGEQDQQKEHLKNILKLTHMYYELAIDQGFSHEDAIALTYQYHDNIWRSATRSSK